MKPILKLFKPSLPRCRTYRLMFSSLVPCWLKLKPIWDPMALDPFDLDPIDLDPIDLGPLNRTNSPETWDNGS